MEDFPVWILRKDIKNGPNTLVHKEMTKGERCPLCFDFVAKQEFCDDGELDVIIQDSAKGLQYLLTHGYHIEAFGLECPFIEDN